MKDKRGFTLIELIVVLGLSGIVISIVMSFFIANYKSYETISTESEVQYQSQYIINYMTNIILEAQMYEGSGTFRFINGEKSEFEVENKKIKHTSYNSNGTVKSVVSIGNYVKDIDITNNTNEVNITLILDKGNGNNYSAEQAIYMRNSN